MYPFACKSMGWALGVDCPYLVLGWLEKEREEDKYISAKYVYLVFDWRD